MKYHPLQPQRTGFTLAETLVAISIVVLLVGILIGAAITLRDTADDSHARTQLGGLIGVSAEYETASTMAINHDSDLIFNWAQPKIINAPNPPAISIGDTAVIQGTPTGPDVSIEESNANLFSERFVWAAYQLPATREALERLGEGMLVDLDEDGFLEMRDPWGNNIAYAVFSTHGAFAEDDFLPQNLNPFFASAGPDGKWGASKTKSELGSNAAWESYRQTSDFEDSRDNH